MQTPRRTALVPVPEESVHFERTGNLFIEGDNLEALKVLQEPYRGRAKMIYIDPPYNTGNDFVYPDNFADPLHTYRQLAGQARAGGNLVAGGPRTRWRHHSAWLSMMYPRLCLARQLLRDDGVLFVSIDDHEVHYLRMLLDELFGEENFVETIIWEKVHTRKNSAKYFSTSHDYILCYARLKQTKPGGPGWMRRLLPREDTRAYANPDGDPRGPWKPDPVYANKPYAADYRIRKPNGVELGPPQGQYWRFSQRTWDECVRQGAVIWAQGAAYPMVKRYLADVQPGLVPVSIFSRRFAGDNGLANSELAQLLGAKRLIDYPKPSLLIKRLLQISTAPRGGDLVIDFFAGSCPTAQAVLALNREDGGDRRFIMVQLAEPLRRPGSLPGGAVLHTIADIGKERIRQVIARLTGQPATGGAGPDANDPACGGPQDLGFKVLKLTAPQETGAE